MDAVKKGKHGISVGVERVGGFCYLLITATGQLTHGDYEQITPVIESALAGVTTPRVRLLFDALNLEGWELRAAWDDFKLGLKHGNDFEKIAIVGNQNWLKLSATVGQWFTSGTILLFESHESALEWLQQ
jgi:hypothetical protein